MFASFTMLIGKADVEALAMNGVNPLAISGILEIQIQIWILLVVLNSP
jgi:hypothetical protein